MAAKKLHVLFAAILILAFFVGACSDGDGDDESDSDTTTTTEPQGVAELRVMHDYTSSTVVKPATVDVYISTDEIDPDDDTPAVEGLEWGTLTQYFDVPSGTYNVGVYAAGGTTELFTAEGVEVAPDATYTAWARASSTNADAMEVELIDETGLDEPDSGGAAVTAVHGITQPAAQGVRVGAVGGGCLDGGIPLSFPNTQTLQVAAAPTQLAIYAPTDSACTGSPLVGPTAVDLEADRSYLVFAIGTAAGDLMLVPGEIRSI